MTPDTGKKYSRVSVSPNSRGEWQVLAYHRGAMIPFGSFPDLGAAVSEALTRIKPGLGVGVYNEPFADRIASAVAARLVPEGKA